MWLPKEERKLFLYYAEKALKNGEACEVSDEELLELLKLQNVEEIHCFKSRLKKRGLISFTTFGPSEHLLNVAGKKTPDISKHPRIRLTDTGEELGERYKRFFGKIQLWYKEYECVLTFLILIIAFLSLIVGLITIFND